MRGLKTLVLAAAVVAVSAGVADAKKKKKDEPAPVQQSQPAAPARPAFPTVETRAKELMDLDAESVRARYGEPALLRKEPPAQVWQYADNACALVVVLYEPKDGKGSPRVKYAEGRMMPGRETDVASCMTGPRSTTPPNASASGLPPANPVVIPGAALSGTPIYSPGDPVPQNAPR